VLLFGGAAAGIIALHLATSGTLGFHTDELYYLDCGRHPAFGYVDFPPVVPLLARLETGLLGVSPWTLRVLLSLLGGFLVALSGAYVRRLGGSLRLQGSGRTWRIWFLGPRAESAGLDAADQACWIGGRAHRFRVAVQAVRGR
jgi:hypothetical protein